ncbi:calmodulin [Hassallia byssoidea VB512170]|uniref:Calmodulin n=2 Tax=Hassallia TaxID=482629 RepID=A0A846H4W6_9CYAN|nr:calmodulin [Hassalia byssoidea VB512170]
MFVVSPASAASDTEAYFAFETRPNEKPFTIKLTDPEKIQKARDILSGKETDTIHVMGRIKKIPADYNSNWDYQLDSSTISFFPVAIEVCDATTNYVNDHLDEVCGAFLPGCFWCPWSSKLVKEVSTN